MKRCIKGATIPDMIDAFEDKIDELEGIDVMSATNTGNIAVGAAVDGYDEGEYVYLTDFRLTADVNDYYEARQYLLQYPMVEYLKDDCPEFADKLVSITWYLRSSDSGTIELITNELLSPEELDKVSNWVSGQNSDGLGEGFEQQEFAYTDLNEKYGYYWDDEEYDPDNYEVASFDWQTNKYKFELRP